MRIQNVVDREKLPIRHDPYWAKVASGCYLGFRKSGAVGSWIARYQSKGGKREFRPLGDFGTTDGSKQYDAAMKAAKEWFDHLGQCRRSDYCRAEPMT